MFAQTLRVTVDIVLLRRGPQDVPASWNLLAVLAAVYLIAHFAQALTLAPPGSALLQAVLATLLLGLYVRAALQVRERVPRLAQTLIALFAVGTVATVLLLGPTAAMGPAVQAMAEGSDMQSVEQPPIPALLAAAVLSVWRLVVYGHIYRHALDMSLGLGVLVALGFELLLPLVFGLLVGAA